MRSSAGCWFCDPNWCFLSLETFDTFVIIWTFGGLDLIWKLRLSLGLPLVFLGLQLLLQILASWILSIVILILGLEHNSDSELWTHDFWIWNLLTWNSFNFTLGSELLTLRHGSEWLTCDFWNLNLCLLLFVIILLFDIELMMRLSKLLDFCISVWHWGKTHCGRLAFDSLRLASLHCSWEQISETLHLYSKGGIWSQGPNWYVFRKTGYVLESLGNWTLLE